MRLSQIASRSNINNPPNQCSVSPDPRFLRRSASPCSIRLINAGSGSKTTGSVVSSLASSELSSARFAADAFFDFLVQRPSGVEAVPVTFREPFGSYSPPPAMPLLHIASPNGSNAINETMSDMFRRDATFAAHRARLSGVFERAKEYRRAIRRRRQSLPDGPVSADLMPPCFFLRIRDAPACQNPACQCPGRFRSCAALPPRAVHA